MKIRPIAPAVILALLLTGCSSSDGASAEPAATTTTSVAPTVEGPTAPEGELVWSEAIGSGDLVSVTIQTDANLLTVQAEGPTPPTGAVLYSVLAGPYQMGLKSVDGDVTVFAFDSAAGTQVRLDNSYIYADSVVTFRIPLAEIPNLPEPLTWSASLSVEGVDVGTTGEVAAE